MTDLQKAPLIPEYKHVITKLLHGQICQILVEEKLCWEMKDPFNKTFVIVDLNMKCNEIGAAYYWDQLFSNEKGNTIVFQKTSVEKSFQSRLEHARFIIPYQIKLFTILVCIVNCKMLKKRIKIYFKV